MAITKKKTEARFPYFDASFGLCFPFSSYRLERRFLYGSDLRALMGGREKRGAVALYPLCLHFTAFIVRPREAFFVLFYLGGLAA